MVSLCSIVARSSVSRYGSPCSRSPVGAPKTVRERRYPPTPGRVAGLSPPPPVQMPLPADPASGVADAQRAVQSAGYSERNTLLSSAESGK